MSSLAKRMGLCLFVSCLISAPFYAAQEPDDYTKKLEAALIAKISENPSNSSIRDGKQSASGEIGKPIVDFMKKEVKPHLLDVLATSDLCDKPTFEKRLEKAEGSLQSLKQKLEEQTYSAELAGKTKTSLPASPAVDLATQTFAPPPVESTVIPGAEPEQPAAVLTAMGALQVSTPTTIPSQPSIPGVVTPVAPMDTTPPPAPAMTAIPSIVPEVAPVIGGGMPAPAPAPYFEPAPAAPDMGEIPEATEQPVPAPAPFAPGMGMPMAASPELAPVQAMTSAPAMAPVPEPVSEMGMPMATFPEYSAPQVGGMPAAPIITPAPAPALVAPEMGIVPAAPPMGLPAPMGTPVPATVPIASQPDMGAQAVINPFSAAGDVTGMPMA